MFTWYLIRIFQSYSSRETFCCIRFKSLSDVSFPEDASSLASSHMTYMKIVLLLIHVDIYLLALIPRSVIFKSVIEYSVVIPLTDKMSTTLVYHKLY